MLGLQLFGIELNESPYDYEAALRKAPLDHRGLTKRRSSLVIGFVQLACLVILFKRF
jgi:hypothetical protein